MVVDGGAGFWRVVGARHLPMPARKTGGEIRLAPNASWGVTGADGRRVGFGGGFQGAAWEADTPPVWRRGLAKAEAGVFGAGVMRDDGGWGSGGKNV